MNLNQSDLFRCFRELGYDSQKLAFNYINKNVEHYRAIEFDKYAIQTLNEIHGTNFQTQDITKVSANDLNIINTNKYTYILTYSFPCTDLSLAGKRAGMDRESGTRSGLLWEVERLLLECKEKPQILIMENVPQVLSAKGWREWQVFLESLGYSNYANILNASHYGIPQHRERCFMVSILGDYNYKFPKRMKLRDRLRDLLENNVDKKYYLSEEKLKKISLLKAQQDPLKDIDKEKEICPCLTARGAGEEHSGMILINEKLYIDNIRERERENCLIIPEATIQGYAKAYEGDGVYINRPHQKRGCVQKDMIQTIKTSPDDIGVVVRVGNYSPSGHNANTIVSGDGIAPTVMENHGTVTAVIEDTPRLVGGIGEMKSNGGKQFYQQDRIYDGNGVAMCHPENLPNGSYNYQLNDLAIRKLTPNECFKLMGVKPSDYNKITCKNSQKYKQAGNSIVTTCLMAIYSQLFNGCDYQLYVEELLKDLRT